MSNIRKKYKGFALIEIMIAVGIFALLAGSVSIFSIDAITFVEDQEITIESNRQANQLLDAVIDYKDNDWDEIISHTDDGQKHIAVTGSTFAIEDGSDVVNGVTQYFTVEEVYRDSSDDIVDTGGLLDPFSRKITVYVEWTDYWGDTKTQTIGTYVNNWNIQRWRNDTEGDFLNGTFDYTQTTTDGNGEVTLELIVDLLPSWCNPALSTTYFDIPGSGIARTVFADIEMAYLGTGGNSSGDAFTKLEVTGLLGQDLDVDVLGSWDGEKVNYIFIDVDGYPDYAWMTTDNNQKEVDVLDHSSTPYTEEGDVDTGGSVDGQSIFVADDVGFVGSGRNFSTFDASTIESDMTIEDTLSLGTSSTVISSIYVRGDYAYVGVETDTNELYILDISDPTDISETGSYSVNSVNTRDVYATVDEEMLFLLTSQSSTEDEFWLIDISTKSSPSTFDSMNVTSMNTTALAVVEEDMVFVVAGENISDEDNYRVFEFDDVYAINDCGGLEITDDIYDISATRLYDDSEEQWNYYTYGVTGNASKEFQIVRGDEGEIGGGGFGYPEEGWFDSPTFDSDSTSPDYHYFRWTETLPEETDLEVQMRVASTEAGLSTATYVGPDGTSGTYYTDPDYAPIHSSMDGNRWFQFQAYMSTTNRDVTPILHTIDIVFEE